MTSYYIPGASPLYAHDGQPFTVQDTLSPGDWLAKAGPDSVGAIAAPDHDPATQVLDRLDTGWSVRDKTVDEVSGELASAQAMAVDLVKGQARQARGQFLTPGKDSVYLKKMTEAAAWTEAGMPADLTAYPYLGGEVGITAASAAEVVALWQSRHQACTTASAAIEAIERQAVKAITQASTVAAVEAATSGLVWPTL